MLNRRTLKRVNERSRQVNRLPLVLVGAGSLAPAGLLYVLLGLRVLALAALLAGVLGVLGAYMAQKARSITSLTYDDLDADLANRFASVREACKDLATSEKIWRLSDSPEQRTLKAGETYSPPERAPARVELLETPGIRADVPIWGIDVGDRKIFFFPDGVLTYRGERYEGLSYKSFKVDFSAARFFEEEEVPADAEVVGRTWRYTREDGSPDRRYKPNPQIPVVLYGLLWIIGPSGLDVRLQVSNRVVAARFARTFSARGRKRANQEEDPLRRAASQSNGQQQEEERWATEEEKTESVAREVLGVTEGASMADITTAYRKLALTYHPDKVAHLKPEVRQFADHKMKEINAAYAQLKRHRRAPPTASFSGAGEPGNSKEG